jgi:hypothetical protein
MTTADTPGDLILGDAVAAEPAWTPSVNAAGTGAAVVDGAVTLSGEVVTRPDGSPAEIAAFRVPGVTAITDRIAIRAWWDAHTDTGTAEVKGAAWAVFQGSCVRHSTGVLPAGVAHQCMDRPIHDLVGSVSVEALPGDGRPTRRGPPRGALISDMATIDRESPVMNGHRTAILPGSATGPPPRAPAAARPNVTICVESVCGAFRRPDGVSRSGDRVPRNQDAVRAAGPFHGTIADGYPTLASAPSFIAATVSVEHPTAPPNDGLNRVRFPAPVPVAGHPRGTVSPHSAEQRPGGVQAVFGLVCEVPLSGRRARVGQLAVLSR